MGGELFDENLSKNRRESSYKARFFTQYSQVFDTSREGGRRIGGPNTPAGALGSPVNFTPNLSDKIQTIRLVPVLRLLLHERYGPTYVLTIL